MGSSKPEEKHEHKKKKTDFGLIRHRVSTEMCQAEIMSDDLKKCLKNNVSLKSKNGMYIF